SASQAMEKDVRDGMTTASPATKSIVENYFQTKNLMRQFGSDQRFAGFYQQQMAATSQQLSDILAKENQPKEDTAVAKGLQSLLNLENQLPVVSQIGYFFNQPNRNTRDLFDFELWLKKADKLGISFSPADVKNLVQQEFYGKFTESDRKDLEDKYLSGKQGFTRDRLNEALANEFKVRAAMSTVLGPQSLSVNNPGTQVISTPYDSYRSFREQCEPAIISVISVPVENYLDQVKGQPTAAEMQEIFSKHRNDEPSPVKERPGLKEPRKLKFEWMEVRGDEAFYKAAAVDALAKSEVQAKLASLLVAPITGAGWSHAVAVAPLTTADPALSVAYDAYKKRFEDVEIRADLFPTFFGSTRVIGPDLVKPGVLAATAASAAGAMMTHATPFTAGLVLEQVAAVENRNTRARVQAAFLVNPFVPGAGPGWASGAFAASTHAMPRPLPLAVLKNELTGKVREELARRLATEDIGKFQVELAKLGLKKEKSEARAYLTKFATERGFKLGNSTAFQSEFTIDGEVGLAPLKQKMINGLPPFSPPVRFGQELFYEFDPRSNPQQPRRIPAQSFYKPENYPDEQGGLTLKENQPSYLVWRTEEVKADAPKTVTQAQAKIEAAWRTMKARELAKASADDLAKQAAASGNLSGTIDAKLRELHTQYQSKFTSQEAKDRTKYFLKTDVTPFPGRNPNNFTPGRLDPTPYTLRASPEMEYPTQAIVETLMKIKDMPLATTRVEPDEGKNAFYIFTVMNRNELSANSFYDMAYP
ncbi:MAG: hypothetical protein ACRCZF_04475, partial [Gemmataceae bacterium]